MKTVLAGLLIAAGLFLGCHAAPDEDPTDAKVAASSDEIVYEASSATQNELGVSTWAVSKTDRGGIQGRDDRGAVVIEVAAQEKNVDGARSLRRFILRHGDETVAMTVSVEIRDGQVVSAAVVEDSFAGTSKYNRTLELLDLDLKAAQPAPGASTRGSVLAQSLRSMSLKPLELGCGNGCYPPGNDGKGCHDLPTQLVKPNCDSLIAEKQQAYVEFMYQRVAGGMFDIVRAYQKLVRASTKLTACQAGPTTECCCPSATPAPPPAKPAPSGPACDLNANPPIPCNCVEKGIYYSC